jgi:hypothetical protein
MGKEEPEVTMTRDEAARILARQFGTTKDLAERLAAPVLNELEEMTAEREHLHKLCVSQGQRLARRETEEK